MATKDGCTCNCNSNCSNFQSKAHIRFHCSLQFVPKQEWLSHTLIYSLVNVFVLFVRQSCFLCLDQPLFCQQIGSYSLAIYRDTECVYCFCLLGSQAVKCHCWHCEGRSCKFGSHTRFRLVQSAPSSKKRGHVATVVKMGQLLIILLLQQWYFCFFSRACECVCLWINKKHELLNTAWTGINVHCARCSSRRQFGSKKMFALPHDHCNNTHKLTRTHPLHRTKVVQV